MNILKTIVAFITRRRKIALVLGAFFSRLFFVSFIFVTALAATRIIPQETFVFRRNEVFRGPSQSIIAAQFRGDEQWLAAAAADGNIFLWDFSQEYPESDRGRARIILPLQEGIPNAITFTHDNRWLISGGTDNKVRFWDVSELNESSIELYKAYIAKVDQEEPFIRFFSFDLHQNQVQWLALSDNGFWLASADQSGAIYVYDLRSNDLAKIRESARPLGEHRVPLTRLVFSPSSHLLAASDGTGKVSVWDMNYIERSDEVFKTASRSFEIRSRVNDIAFDLSFAGTTRQPERLLFAAGNDQQIHALSLHDGQNLLLPHLHKSPITRLALTRDPDLNDYWLVSADQSGAMVFWDMNQWDTLTGDPVPGQQFWQVSGHTMEITSMEVSLNQQAGVDINSASRHLLVTGSGDRSVSVFQINDPSGRWRPTSLRPYSGKIHQAFISPFHTYIVTIGRDHTLRLWDTAHVTDVSAAFPFGQFARFLIPIFLGLVFAVHSTSTFIMQTYNVLQRKNAITYIFSALFGFNFDSVGLFLLSLIVPIFPKVEVFNGKLQKDADTFYSIDIIGGPGEVIVRPGNWVAFQTIRGRTAVVTNANYFLRPFEKIRKIISLDDQFHEYAPFKTYTRDGIAVNLKKVRIRYRVKFVNSHAGSDQRVVSRFQDVPDPVNKYCLDQALNSLFWSEAILALTKSRFIRYVNLRPLDFFTAPQRFELNERARENFKNFVIDESAKILSEFGAELIFVDVGEIEILEPGVVGARIAVWDWKERAPFDRLRSEGKADLETAREMGRLDGEARILRAIIEQFEKFESDLTQDSSSNVPFQVNKTKTKQEEDKKRKRVLFLNRMAELLRTYLQSARSEMFGAPFFNPNDPAKKK